MPAQQTESSATWSLVLGILSFVCLGVLAGIPAIILGKSAQQKIDNSCGTLTGRELATVGIVFGWISVVFTGLAIVFVVLIMAGSISMAFLTQTGSRSSLQQVSADSAVAASESLVKIAYSRYRHDHGNIPSIGASGDEEVDTDTLIAALAKLDQAGQPYYSPNTAVTHLNGVPVDPWGNKLHFGIDISGDDKVTLRGTDISSTVITWSAGPDGKNDHGKNDDVVSWERTDQMPSLER